MVNVLKAAGIGAGVIGRILWLCALGGAVFGGLDFGLTQVLHGPPSPAISAPQLAALAASSLTWAVIPYVVARAWDELTKHWPKEG